MSLDIPSTHEEMVVQALVWTAYIYIEIRAENHERYPVGTFFLRPHGTAHQAIVGKSKIAFKDVAFRQLLIYYAGIHATALIDVPLQDDFCDPISNGRT